MKTYKKPQNCSDLLVKKCNEQIWQERMNAKNRYKDLEVQKVRGAVLKGAFAICEVTNNLINLKNNKDISGKELRLQLSNAIKICIESLTFQGMANLEEDNIRRQYLSKILQPKLVPLRKDVPTSSEFLSGNNLNDSKAPLRQVKKCCRPISILLTIIKIQETCKDFQKALEIKIRGKTTATKPEVTTTTKNNDRAINDCNTTRETELQ